MSEPIGCEDQFLVIGILSLCYTQGLCSRHYAIIDKDTLVSFYWPLNSLILVLALEMGRAGVASGLLVMCFIISALESYGHGTDWRLIGA